MARLYLFIDKREPAVGFDRVMLKLSGEAMAGPEKDQGLDAEFIQAKATEIADAAMQGIQVAIVVGGGNLFRGADLARHGMDRPRGDYMGMLSTVINALGLQDFLEKAGMETRVQAAITMGQIAEPYIPRRAIRHLEKGRIVIFAAGLGAPYFSTDTTAAQRGLEIGAQLILSAKNGTKGVYDCDPKSNPDAVFYDHLTFMEAIDRRLEVMDMTAFTLCSDNDLPIRVFDMLPPSNIFQAITGEEIGTIIRSRFDT